MTIEPIEREPYRNGTASSDSSIDSVPGIVRPYSHRAASPERIGRPVATTWPVIPSPTLILSASMVTTPGAATSPRKAIGTTVSRSEEHTSELQSLRHLVCRLLLEKKK